MLTIITLVVAVIIYNEIWAVNDQDCVLNCMLLLLFLQYTVYSMHILFIR